MSPRWRLILAGAAFLGWMGYLGYAAMTKSRAPVVSHIQSAAAEVALVAELNDGPAPTVTVVEVLWGKAPEGRIEVVNLATARGFAGPGKYLLYLRHLAEGWAVVGSWHSPGDGQSLGAPFIYPWSEDVLKQAKQLKPKE